jgi:hypothetical protein
MSKLPKTEREGLRFLHEFLAVGMEDFEQRTALARRSDEGAPLCRVLDVLAGAVAACAIVLDLDRRERGEEEASLWEPEAEVRDVMRGASAACEIAKKLDPELNEAPIDIERLRPA